MFLVLLAMCLRLTLGIDLDMCNYAQRGLTHLAFWAVRSPVGQDT